MILKQKYCNSKGLFIANKSFWKISIIKIKRNKTCKYQVLYNYSHKEVSIMVNMIYTEYFKFFIQISNGK